MKEGMEKQMENKQKQMRFLINYTLSKEQAIELIKLPRDKISLDIETVSLVNRLPLGIGIGISPDVGFYFFNPKDEFLHLMIENTPTIIFHNAKYDIPILSELGYKINNYEDTRMLAYSAGILETSLEALSSTILLKSNPSVTSQWRKKDQGNVAISHIILGGMCITHSCNTYALYETIQRTELYDLIDKPCIELLIEMERWGLLIDQYQLTKVEQQVIDKATPMEKELKEELKVENLFSNPQVAQALRDNGIIGTRKTKSAKDSVSEDSLRPLDLPLTNKLLEWRSLMKNLTTYVPAFRKVNSKGRLCTQFGFTNTGRWSSKEPNHQNITRDERFNSPELDNEEVPEKEEE